MIFEKYICLCDITTSKRPLLSWFLQNIFSLSKMFFGINLIAKMSIFLKISQELMLNICQMPKMKYFKYIF